MASQITSTSELLFDLELLPDLTNITSLPDNLSTDELVDYATDSHPIRNSTSTTQPLTGNVYIDGILWGGNRLDSNTITYSFWDDRSLDDQYDDYALQGYSWLPEEIAAFQVALETWSNVADITFVAEPDNQANADLGFLSVDNWELDDDLGSFNPPGTDGEGIGYFNWEGYGWFSGSEQGGYGFITIIHELGHALGLAHPHDDGGGSPVYPGFVPYYDLMGDDNLNQGIWTTMSYNDGWASENWSHSEPEYGYQGTPMAFDIAAVQHLYGANTNYKTGNDIYTLPTQNQSGTFYSCLWDANGEDTISARAAKTDVVINLNDAPLKGRNAGGYVSAVEDIIGGFTIANGAVIENAIGGAGNDDIIGNQVDNVLQGGTGMDTINGQNGDDQLLGMGGADTLVAGLGDDVLSGGAADDILRGGRGEDLLQGGSGDDVISGGDGDDVLIGGAGADIFHLTKTAGTTFIEDFNIKRDRLGVSAKIDIDAIDVVQKGDRAIVKFEGDRLAALAGVNAEQVTDDLFVAM